MISFYRNFWYNPISLKDGMSSILTFSNRSNYESGSATFCKNVFNGARRLTYQTQWQLFLLQYESK